MKILGLGCFFGARLNTRVISSGFVASANRSFKRFSGKFSAYKNQRLKINFWDTWLPRPFTLTFSSGKKPVLQSTKIGCMRRKNFGKSFCSLFKTRTGLLLFLVPQKNCRKKVWRLVNRFGIIRLSNFNHGKSELL